MKSHDNSNNATAVHFHRRESYPGTWPTERGQRWVSRRPVFKRATGERELTIRVTATTGVAPFNAAKSQKNPKRFSTTNALPRMNRIPRIDSRARPGGAAIGINASSPTTRVTSVPDRRQQGRSSGSL